MAPNSFYPGAEVVYIDAEDMQRICQFPVYLITPADVGVEKHYDIDLQALFKCASGTYGGVQGFSNPMPATPNIPVTVIDWALEGKSGPTAAVYKGYLGVAVSNMVTH